MMSAASADLRAEIRATVLLAGPLIVSQLASIGMTVIEMMLAGHLSPRVLGAVAIGSNVWHLAAMGLLGVMSAIAPNVAQFDGGGRREAAGPLFRQALWLGGFLGVAAMLLLAFAGPLLVAEIGVDATLLAEATAFLRATSLGALPLALYLACRGLSEGLSLPRPSMVIGLLALPLLLPVGYVLMYPLGLGAGGAGLAMSVTLWAEFAAFAFYISRSPHYRGLGWRSGPRGPDLGAIRGLLRLGGPMAIAVLMETGMFSATALLIARFGEVAVSGHQIALSVTSVSFMIPLGLAIATTVRVGHAVGRGDMAGVRRSAKIGLTLATLSQLVAAVLMLSLPLHIAGLYTTDPAVVSFAAGLLFLAALFQLSDGAQVTAAAALRGMKDARVPMLICICAYWTIGMPLGWLLTFNLGLGAPGMWWGLIVALSAAAAMLWFRFQRMTAGAILPAGE